MTRPPTTPEFAQALLAEQTRLHGRVLGLSLGATLVAAALLTIYLHGFVPAGPLLAWVGVLALAVALRGGVHMLQRRAAAATPRDPRWRRRYRLAALLHGCTWALGAWVLMAATASWQVEVLVLALTVIAAGGLLVLAFDRTAAWMHTAPLLLPLAMLALQRPPAAWPRSLVAAALVLPLAALAMGCRRRQLQAALAQQLVQQRPSADLRRDVAAFDRAGGRPLVARIGAEVRRVDDRIVAVDGALHDVTPQHAAAQAQRLFEVVINASAELISVLDEQETYLIVNDAWCRAFGLRREQVLGRRREDFMPGVVSAERIQALRACLHERRRVVVRDVVLMPGQPLRTLHTDFYPVALGDQQPRLAALVTRDVTQEEARHAALVAATEYLRGTLEATGEAIFATDASDDDEPARFVNDQLFALWNLPAALRGRLTSSDLLRHMSALMVDPDAEVRRMEAIVRAGVPVDDYRLPLRDGRLLKLRFACARVNGRLLRVWSGRDITAEHAALAAREAAAAEQRAMLDNFPGHIAVIDGQGRYLHVNERLAALMRRPAAAIVGQPASQVLGDARWRQLQHTLDQARRSGQAVSLAQYPAPDGSGTVDLEVTHVAGPRHADGSQVVYAFGVDVTERRRAQAALIDALAEAERANKAKTQFLSSMSHELRTPLNAVLGFGQLLAQQPLPPDQQRQVQEILRGGRHLLGLINDLLDLGRIEAGELEVVCEAVDAHAAIAECLAMMAPLAQEHGVSLRHRGAGDPALPVRADPKRLRQVLLNLLSNAVKYNQPGGAVIVDAGPRGEGVEFRVHDTGPGLSHDEQQRLFRPFERLQARRGSVDGTGIGLALSRRLVEAMQGRIGIVSEPGQGSTFWFQLPTADAPAAVAGPAAAATPGAAAGRLQALYIEDNPVNLILMAAMLEDELDLAVEADPLRGLQQAQALRPDLILLDIQLPGIDGYEVLRRLRADDRTRAIPVVAVSANAMRSDVEAGRAAGFDAYLTKPVDLDELLATVRAVCGRERR